MKVGFHAAVISIPAMILSWIVGIPLGIIFGGIAVMTTAIIGTFSLLLILEMLIGFMFYGYMLVRFRKWIFSNNII